MDKITGLFGVNAPPMGGMPAGNLPVGNMPERTAITTKEIQKATQTLIRYKQGKSNLESRIVEDEEWYKLRHWEVIRRNKQAKDPREIRPEPASAWLFNAIMNKHADAMDNYPEPNVLPRERADEPDAKILSEILPVILERNDFEETYSDNWWEKLKHGTAAYGVFWNNELESGLGDIDIQAIDLLNIFWEPGITDIQKSRDLFIVDLRDKEELEAEYPQLAGKLQGDVIDVKQYIYDDDVDVSDKSVVVDWYYKAAMGGKTVLHYAKYVGETLLFSSENDPKYTDIGWYSHGMYPVVFDSLFPEKGTPVGFGYVAITKDPQMYIDKLGQNILENSLMATKPRFFANAGMGINEDEFLDWSKPIVHVEGNINEERLRPIETTKLDGVYVNIMQMKIDELKETSANRDFSQGGTGSGVTAAAAIAALQEAGNKSSRDMIAAAYRSYTALSYLCIELIRQFYDETRSFRITGQGGNNQFIDYSNASIAEQALPPAYPGQELEPGYEQGVRKPIFDITIKAQKKNPYSRMSQNELAKELYGMGFFSPQRAQEALGALELMDFEGKSNVEEYVRQGQTLQNIIQQMGQQIRMMAAQIDIMRGVAPQVPDGEEVKTSPSAPPGGSGAPTGGKDALAVAMGNAALATNTPYGDRLAARAQPNMNRPNNQVMK